MCEDCGYCGDCVTLCEDCKSVCDNCVLICADCGECEKCVEFCDECGLCVSCCAAVTDSFDCVHGICVESKQWKTHYCLTGKHCITSLVGPQYNETEHWYLCGKDCGGKIGASAHSFGEGVITKQPTAEEDGILSVKCNECDYVKTATIPKLTGDHTHNFVAVITAPSCTAGGYTTHTCSCSASWTDSETPATGHSYAYAKNDTEHWQECSSCGDKLAAQSHRYGAWNITKEATYTQPGEKQHICADCGYVEKAVIPTLAHTGSFVITLDGYGKQLLTTGLDKLVPELPVLDPKAEGNIFEGWADKETGNPVKAGDKLSGDIVLVPVWKDCGTGKHIDKNDDDVCDVCGYTDASIPHYHNFGAWVSDNNKGFFKNGTESHICLDCGAVETRTEQRSAGIYHIIPTVYAWINKCVGTKFGFINKILEFLIG